MAKGGIGLLGDIRGLAQGSALSRALGKASLQADSGFMRLGALSLGTFAIDAAQKRLDAQCEREQRDFNPGRHFRRLSRPPVAGIVKNIKLIVFV